MIQNAFAILLVVLSLAAGNVCSAQGNTVDELTAQVDSLELKLRVAERTIELLQKELDGLRPPAKDASQPTEVDLFEAGAVWVGDAVDNNRTKIRWALSVSKRTGRRFEGAVAAVDSKGRKLEYPVSGTAPHHGDGLVVFESPQMDRGKVFVRGQLRTGRIELAFSITSPQGAKVFGTAMLSADKKP